MIAGLPYEASLVAVERYACETMRKVAKQYNSKFPEVIAIVHEMDPRYVVGMKNAKWIKQMPKSTLKAVF